VSGEQQAAAVSTADASAADAPRRLVFEMEIPIRWGDMDAVGHVNNTVYFRYMEQLRISWFESMDLSAEPDWHGPVIVDARCSFLRELRYPGTVLARHYIGEIGRSSFQTYAQMARTDDPATVYAEGAVKVVWIDRRQRRSVALSEQVRRELLLPRLRLAP